MSLLDTIRRALARNPAKVEGATVTIAERTNSRFRHNDQAALVKRFVGTSAFCASLNARALASCNFALYRKKRRGSSDARGVSRRQFDWLRTRIDGPGAKANTRASSDDIELVEVSPILDVMRDPNALDTGYEFWEAHHTFKEIAGNSYCYVWHDGKYPRLELLFPQWTRVIPSADGIVGGYAYGRSKDIEVTFTPEEVVHERFTRSVFSPYYGAAPMEQAMQAHDIRTAMNEWSLKVFDRNARPDYAIVFKKPLTDTQKQQMRDEVKRRYQGMENIGEVMILSGGEADVKPLGWNMKELDYVEGRKVTDTEICTAFGVPETFLRPNEGALSQARSMQEWYCRNTLLPRAVKHQEWLNERFIPLFTNSDGYFFVVDNPVPQDEALQASRTSALVNVGVMTINEARYINGLDASEEEGASILRYNGVPLDKVGAVPTFGGLPNGPGADGSGTNGDRPTGGGGAEEEPAATPSADGGSGDAEAGGKAGPGDGNGSGVSGDKVGDPCCDGSGVGKVVSQADVWKSAASPLYRANTDPMADAALAYFKAHMKATLKAMDESPQGHQKHGPRSATIKDAASAEAEARRLLGVWGIDDPKWVKYLADRLEPLANDRMTSAAIQGIRYVQEFAAVAEAAKPENFTLQNPRAASWATANTADLLKACDGINKTTAEQIGAALAEGILDGESIAALKKRVKAVYESEMPGGESMSDYRAMVIARTETARAQMNGTLAGWDATEVVEGKQWLLSPDSCEFCEAAAAQYAQANTPLGTSFYGVGSTITGTQGGTMSIDFAAVDGAPLHPNCLLPGTKISARGIVAGYSARYRGEAVKLTLSNGCSLSVTANHQLLTPFGLVRAGDLAPGDDLVNAPAGEWVDACDPDTHKVDALIENVVASLPMASGMTDRRVPVSSEHLHGDGAFINEYVDVVASDGLLIGDAKAASLDQFADLPLCFGWGASTLDSLGDLDSMLLTLSLSAYSRMARCGKCGALGGRQLGHPNESGFGLAANCDAGSNEPTLDSSTINAETLGSGENRLPGKVTACKVINVDRFDYSGHVYDLQTETGLYSAGNVIVANCKCSMVPVLKGYGPAVKR